MRADLAGRRRCRSDNSHGWNIGTVRSDAQPMRQRQTVHDGHKPRSSSTFA